MTFQANMLAKRLLLAYRQFPLLGIVALVERVRKADFRKVSCYFS
jgi:hypothetical protein